MKKIIILTALLMACAVVSASATSVSIDGKNVDFACYNIDDNNYFKLRDIALALSGSGAQFDVVWNEENSSVEMISDTPYSGERVTSGEISEKPEIVHSYSPLYLNGKRVSAKAYNIDGFNYFKLRDVAKLINFGVFWSQESGISIDTARAYALTAEEEKNLYIEYAQRRHPEFVKQNEGWNEDKKYYNFADVDRDGKAELAVKKSNGITIYKAIDGEVQRMYCDPLPESNGETQYHYVTYDGYDCIAYITEERITLYILSGDSLSPVGELKPEEIEKIVFPERYTLEEIIGE